MVQKHLELHAVLNFSVTTFDYE